MTEDSHSDEPPAQGSVFGNLPDSRPGTRSPRRRTDGDAKGRSGARAAKAKAPASKAKAAPAAKAKTPATKAKAPPAAKAKRPAPPREAPAERIAGGEGGGGIEDLAWAGVAAAAEAATLGVRLASRALDALRGTSERD